MDRTVGGKTIRLIQGDITDLEVAAIVNAANDRLVLGGGVAGAILARGGQTIQDECYQLGGTTVGQAVVTGGGRLKAKYVIHAVGPRLGEGNEDMKLKNATLNSLRRASELGIETVAFPAISTGIFGFPKDICAKIMISTTRDFLSAGPSSLREVIFCLWSVGDLGIFEKALESQIPQNS